MKNYIIILFTLIILTGWFSYYFRFEIIPVNAAKDEIGLVYKLNRITGNIEMLRGIKRLKVETKFTVL